MKYISFAIPCYNSEAYMEKAINSILIGGEDVEILIVNDGSKDGTQEICNREKGVPAGWITKDGSDVSDEFIRYAKPLIQGEVQVPQQDGLPLFAYRK